MSVYYNEIDPFCAEWLRRLMVMGMIVWGDVDERSIEDVCPEDLKGYDQVHLYAGIGVWSHALRRAGWEDGRPVWTFSEPCQPFSQAGKRAGAADERYLRPATHHLVRVCRPDVCLGEQVASKDGLAWLDTLSSDMEGEGYAGGAVDLCVAGVGGPHIRQRLFFVWVRNACGARAGWDARAILGEEAKSDKCRIQDGAGGICIVSASGAGGLREPSSSGCGEGRQVSPPDDDRRMGERFVERLEPASCSASGGLSDSQGHGRSGWAHDSDEGRRERASGSDGAAGRLPDDGARLAIGSIEDQQRRTIRFEGTAFGANEPVRGFWSGADWLWYRDGKYRPVEAGTFPLAPSTPGRVGRLRAYGNSINAEVATIFIEEAMKVMP